MPIERAFGCPRRGAKTARWSVPRSTSEPPTRARSVQAMLFRQLTIDASDPARSAAFWATALEYRPVPASEPDTTWNAHYRAQLGQETAFDDRLFDPTGLRRPIWFQKVPETKAGKNRLHLDLYPIGRELDLPMERRIGVGDARGAELVDLGASVERCTHHDDPEDPRHYVVMHDPEGNEFCFLRGTVPEILAESA